MAGEPPAKRRQLPFKPPSRTAGDAAASSADASTAPKGKPKGVAKQPPAQASSSKAPATKPQPAKQTNTASTSSNKRPHIFSNALPATPSDFGSDSDSNSDTEETTRPTRERPLSEEPDYILAEITSKKPDRDVESDKPAIPPQLITRLLHHHFKNEKTRIAKDADAVVAKYVDTFVREAIARAALESRANEKKGEQRADGFLEVCFMLHGSPITLEHELIFDTGRRSRAAYAATGDGFLSFEITLTDATIHW